MVLLRNGVVGLHTPPRTCSPCSLMAPQAGPGAMCTLARLSVLAPDLLRGEGRAPEVGVWLLGGR